jgi:hypothetical protein
MQPTEQEIDALAWTIHGGPILITSGDAFKLAEWLLKKGYGKAPF